MSSVVVRPSEKRIVSKVCVVTFTSYGRRPSPAASIVYLPDWTVSESLVSGALRRVLPEWASPPITAWAVYRAELRGVARLRAVLQVLPSGSSNFQGQKSDA
ncbi:MAG: hypothetical protein ACOY0T_39020 [Myxococcota bacterium]